MLILGVHFVRACLGPGKKKGVVAQKTANPNGLCGIKELRMPPAPQSRVVLHNGPKTTYCDPSADKWVFQHSEPSYKNSHFLFLLISSILYQMDALLSLDAYWLVVENDAPTPKYLVSLHFVFIQKFSLGSPAPNLKFLGFHQKPVLDRTAIRFMISYNLCSVSSVLVSPHVLLGS